jgi:diguanylate cyclase (GGDEF)-like protein
MRLTLRKRLFLSHFVAAAALAGGVAVWLSWGDRRELAIALTASVLAAALLAAVFGAAFGRAIERSAAGLLERVTAITGGESRGRIELPSHDPLAELARALNVMSRRLLVRQEQAAEVAAALAAARQQLDARPGAGEKSQVEPDEEQTRAATTDPLTGLLNRPALLRLLEQEAERVRRNRRPLALLLAHIDQLRDIKQRLAPEVGDQALVFVALLLRQSVRGQDAVARWDETALAVLLPETNLAGALEVGAKLREALAEHGNTVGGQRLGLTLSLGVSVMEDATTVGETIRRAELALQHAEAGGGEDAPRTT